LSIALGGTSQVDHVEHVLVGRVGRDDLDKAWIGVCLRVGAHSSEVFIKEVQDWRSDVVVSAGDL
jgi:hypothetical protein